jgi:AraC-like DNA-binding protein
VRQRLEAVADHSLGNAPSIRSVLKGFGFSYGHLCRVFKQRHGITPLGYVNALRIERAKGLLADTTQSVTDVAGRLGFDNLAYFSRLFRKRAGQTPTAFRLASATSQGSECKRRALGRAAPGM